MRRDNNIALIEHRDLSIIIIIISEMIIQSFARKGDKAEGRFSHSLF